MMMVVHGFHGYLLLPLSREEGVGETAREDAGGDRIKDEGVRMGEVGFAGYGR